MDDIVKAAMAKWPNVPDCHGWLGLDGRGRWWMRDAAAQALGTFAGPGARPGSRGSELRHDKLIGFIQRNYGCNDAGEWFFQNGPQRVYVELEHAPWIWRVQVDGWVISHTGSPAPVRSSWLDEDGLLYLYTDLGLGVVHPQDMDTAADQVLQGRWVPQECTRAALESRFGFVRSPARARSAA
jgi:hypothetical protein